MNWFQPIISLFTTGGRINPMALLVFAITALLAYDHLKLTLKHRELLRQTKVIEVDSRQKIETLNEAKDEQKKAIEVIDNGKFDNDFLKRLQQSD